MRNRSICFKPLVLTVLLLALNICAASGQSIASADEPADLDTELNRPAIPSKQVSRIRSLMDAESQDLIDRGYNVELIRNQEVIAVTIPLDNLYAPNRVDLSATAYDLLKPFTDFTRHYGKFKIILAVHSDNTGSAAYKNWLCEQRIISLYDYFDTHGSTPGMVFGYPMADQQPLADNDSYANRVLNRRLEIFIVPGPQLITETKGRK